MPTFNPATLDALPGEPEQPPLRLLATDGLTRSAAHRPQPHRLPRPAGREALGLWTWWLRRASRLGGVGS